MPVRSAFTSFFRPIAFQKELMNFALGAFFVTLGNSFLLVAEPIFLYVVFSTSPLSTFFLPNATPFQLGLFGVLLFQILRRVMQLFLLPTLAKFILKWGFSHSMIVGVLCGILKYFLFLLLPSYPWMVVVLAFLGAISLSLYWISYHTVLTMEVVESELGRDIGSMEFLSKLAQILAPLWGALLTAHFGFHATVLAASGAYVTSFLFFLKLPKLSAAAHWSWETFWSWIESPKNHQSALGMMGYYWETIGFMLFWPLFLYTTFSRIETVGYILSASSLASLMVVYLTGWVFDHKKGSGFLQIFSSVSVGAMWLPRLFLTGFPLLLVLNDAVDRIINSMYGTMFNATLILRARGRDAFHFHMNREVLIAATYTIMFSLCLALVVLGWNWSILFSTFILAAPLSMIFRKEIKKV